MKDCVLFLSLLLSMGFMNSYGDESPVDEKVAFGKQDSRGAYQEVKFSAFKLKPDYFDNHNQFELAQMKEMQLNSKIYSEGPHDTWGLWGTIYFQDGQLKADSYFPAENTSYPLLDTKGDYCFVTAIVSFDNEAELKGGIYSVSGVVTLVTGESYAGPVTIGGPSGNSGPASNFKQMITLGYKNTGAYNYKPGTPFNAFGNGKNDQGRIHKVGCVTHSYDEIAVGVLKKAVGPGVQVVYP